MSLRGDEANDRPCVTVELAYFSIPDIASPVEYQKPGVFKRLYF